AEKPARIYKRPPVVAAPVYGWTGFYVGGNIGYSWGYARTDIAASGTTSVFTAVVGFPGIPSTTAFADSNRVRLNGVVGGGQVGYNYQFSPVWVLGFEADIQGSRERGSNTLIDPFSGSLCSATTGSGCRPDLVPNTPYRGAAATLYDAKIGWFGTA